MLALLAVLAIAFGATACGSDDGGDSDSGGTTTTEQEPLSKEDYLDQVNEAQTEYVAEVSKLNLANPSGPKDFAKSLDKVSGLTDTLEQQFADIVPPEDVTAEHEQLTQTLSDYNTVIKQQLDNLTSGDPQKVAEAAKKIGAASTTFSEDFDTTIDQINENLGLETNSSK